MMRLHISFRYAYDNLLSRIPQALGAVDGNVVSVTGSLTAPILSHVTKLNQSDYPMIKYWNHDDWKKNIKMNKGISTGGEGDPKSLRGPTRMAEGINVAMR